MSLPRAAVITRTLRPTASKALQRRLASTPNRALRTSTVCRNAPIPPAAPTPSPSPPPPPPKAGRWTRFVRGVGYTTLFTVVSGTAAIMFYVYRERVPGAQLPFDKEKKTIVVLGTGWGATSLLKNIDTEDYNVVVVSPRNYFLFTPLLPSAAVGTLGIRSILQPIRYITRFKTRSVAVVEAQAEAVDPVNKTVTFSDTSDVKGLTSSTTIGYDYLVYAVGAETQTFGIPGVKENAVFMKELQDAENMQRRFMDCLETAAFPGQSKEEIERLLHVVVVGGGPTGIELSGELHDFLHEDLQSWYPELASSIKITLVEALPSVLPSFSKQLIDYTEKSFRERKMDVLVKTMVKEIKPTSVVLQMPDGTMQERPCGMVVWAGGNKGRQVTMDLMAQLPEEQTNKRGIMVDDYLRMVGAPSIFSIGDCTASSYAPTAQVASQQGAYLATVFKNLAKKEKLEAKLKVEGEGKGREVRANDAEVEATKKQLQRYEKALRPFHYTHQGSLAYIGSDKAISDLPFMNGNFASGGVMTYLFWRSVYLSSLFSFRNRMMVADDWIKTKMFGRDLSRE
ncbi:FAD/NAD-P-binding domain-containing protein [Pterulicium gracile]|uniref:NADH:ubiquinone reductase (non-electrogenic) n=1 Tax=Pterulicium gracile TaxID=1884261 RepID=A0A5C3Q0C4_9AGAR|nr:FAD/NAD-P-binding domain-containing protein [Pterula gracilis]